MATTRLLPGWEFAGLGIAIALGIAEHLKTSNFCPRTPYSRPLLLSHGLGLPPLSGSFQGVLARRACLTLGLMTYPLYPVHNFVGRALEAKIEPIGPWTALVLTSAAMIGSG